MRYFYDTEFLEGKQDKKFLGIKYGETPPTIDLISIGIVCEDGREYYAISKDFNLKEAWNRWQQRTGEGDRNNIEPKLYWIRENVLKPLMQDARYRYDWPLTDTSDRFKGRYDYKDFKYLINKYGKSNKKIAEEICDFIDARVSGNTIIMPGETSIKQVMTTNVEFYAYYADYDWVVFCWLFGKMIDLPKGFPMYTIDLKQELERKRIIYDNTTQNIYWEKLEDHKTYPKQINEHSSIYDAK